MYYHVVLKIDLTAVKLDITDFFSDNSPLVLDGLFGMDKVPSKLEGMVLLS